ncbi:Protein of unknown function DUF371 [Methanocaldococcus infernus ME]|uniref:DUF371 domain-containing protein n=1 Tax=Methanocaldococcus infernus (strain DSM 11812 / JCM 15783 / ME) TaxID=573063 RepID=D5VS00_METIM|nr:DUF371 domain-containing protein [Methanocaldococcus infernus]ADG13353.1 Protein of unknown function DUF371 [Methanocaldococcus infernus ME]
MEFIIKAKGHRNVSARHKGTIEITKEDYLTPTGDCIIGISADKSMLDFPEEFKELLRRAKKIVVEIEVDGIKERIEGEGHKELILEHPTDIVIRKSSYICPRTLMIKANKGAKDINREIVKKLKKGKELIFKIKVEP